MKDTSLFSMLAALASQDYPAQATACLLIKSDANFADRPAQRPNPLSRVDMA